MREVWYVTSGEYSDYSVSAIASSKEQAEALVACDYGDRVEGPHEMWEPEDGLPEVAVAYFCTIYEYRANNPWMGMPKPGQTRDDLPGVGVQIRPEKYPAGHKPETKTSWFFHQPVDYLPWTTVEAKWFDTPEEAERAARAAYARSTEEPQP